MKDIMTQESITLIPLRAGLACLMRSRSSYYAALSPSSKHYDPDMPRTVAVGSAPNSPRAFLAHELSEYVEKLVARSRTSGDHEDASKAHARKLVSARKSRRAANQGE